MRVLYGLLGVTAKASGKMSRFRINLIPSNWIVIGVCGLMTAVAFGLLLEAMNTPTMPQNATVAQVYQGASHQRYLTVTGELHPEQSITGKSGSSSLTLFPMIDRASQRGFFVEAPAGTYGNAPRQVTLTGTTHGLDKAVRNAVDTQFNTGSVKFNPYISLIDGGKPEGPLPALLMLLGCGLVGGLFLLSSLMQHTIFQRTRGAATAPASTRNASPMNAATQDASPFSSPPATQQVSTPVETETDADLRMTGRLRLHEKLAQRFLEVPVSPVHLEDGSFAFASNIDASSRMYGVVTQKRAGLWLAMPKPNSLTWEEGLLYNGFKPRPALRLNYADALDKDRKASAILSFGSEAARTKTIGNLQQEIERARVA